MLRNLVSEHASKGSMLWGLEQSVALSDLGAATSLDCRERDISGRSVVIFVDDQLSAGLALIELDGTARRMVLCPPDLDPSRLPQIIVDAEADAIVVGRDQNVSGDFPGLSVIRCGLPLAPRVEEASEVFSTEWALLTSGTSGPPKIVAHTLDSLSDPIRSEGTGAVLGTWATFFDIRRYGGLQAFLRAIIGGCSLVLSHPHESVADYLQRVIAHDVTHMNGTPSHWRRALMTPDVHRFQPVYVRMSGEIADQSLLDGMRLAFPLVEMVNVYGSTEAGVAFEVRDGLEGFPMSVVDSGGDVEVRVVDGELRVRSDRTAMRYLGLAAPRLRDDDGFVSTSDMVERRDERWYFAGRRDGVINVGGLKVHPEEVETLINRHDQVRASLVKGRANPITGKIVVAEIVLKSLPNTEKGGKQVAAIKEEILAMCRHSLPIHKVPATIRVVETLEMSAGGKLVRRNA